MNCGLFVLKAAHTDWWPQWLVVRQNQSLDFCTVDSMFWGKPQRSLAIIVKEQVCKDQLCSCSTSSCKIQKECTLFSENKCPSKWTAALVCALRWEVDVCKYEGHMSFSDTLSWNSNFIFIKNSLHLSIQWFSCEGQICTTVPNVTYYRVLMRKQNEEHFFHQKLRYPRIFFRAH